MGHTRRSSLLVPTTSLPSTKRLVRTSLSRALLSMAMVWTMTMLLESLLFGRNDPNHQKWDEEAYLLKISRNVQFVRDFSQQSNPRRGIAKSMFSELVGTCQCCFDGRPRWGLGYSKHRHTFTKRLPRGSLLASYSSYF